MAEFGWQELAALCLGLLILGGCVAWGLRHSRSTIAAIHADVAAFDAVLRALETPELRVHPGPVYEHPMVGSISAHSTLLGTLHGFAIHVDLLDPYGDAERYPEYVVRVRVTAPLGQAFEGARDSNGGSSPAFDPHSKAFQTQVDGRSLVVTETPTRTSTTSELRWRAPSLGSHLRRVLEFARSIIVPSPLVPSHAPPTDLSSALFCERVFLGKRVFLLDSDRPAAFERVPIEPSATMRLGSFALLLATMCTSGQPAQSVPAAPSPVESSPVESSPVESSPVESSPVESSPVESEPAEPSAPEATATVCDASPVRRQILQALFADQDFRDYVCDEPCSGQAFANEVVLRQELLSQQAATWGCFAEPKRQATTGLFAVFLVQNGVVDWHVLHSGIYIGTKRGHFTNGYTDLEATEREYPATWLTHHLVWNGKTYVVKSTEVAR